MWTEKDFPGEDCGKKPHGLSLGHHQQSTRYILCGLSMHCNDAAAEENL